MIKQQKIAIVLLPLLALAILFGADTIFGGPKGEFYEGVAEGYNGEIKVKVEVASGEILSIDIIEINDTPGLGDDAARVVADRIIEAQSTEVDTVTNATSSSKGTIKAVEDALAKAPRAYTDGSYNGVGKGYAGDIKVQVDVTNGKIQSIEILEINDTEGIGDKAARTVADSIIATQSTEVDTVSNATMSSLGTIQAVKDALGIVEDEAAEEVAAVEENYPPLTIELSDGEYEGIGKGFDGDIKLQVVVAEGKITAIELLEFNDTPGIGDKAAETIIEKVISHQSVEIDAVTNATLSSKGTIEGVKNALGL